MSKGEQSICLCMIVKDEVDVLGRCLDSCRELIDRWVICDTGSTDGTQELIRRELADIPGELHEHEWVNFGHNRSELMRVARGQADYLLLLDADTTLEAAPGALEGLTADSYLLRHEEGTTYYTKRLVRGALDWRYIGAVHEYITSEEDRKTERRDGLVIRSWSVGGARKGRWERDAEMLEAEVERDPGDARSRFYLAQTYRDLGNQNGDTAKLELAFEHYRRRTEMDGWVEETYCAWHQAGVLSAQLGDWPRAAEALMRAWELRPARLEAVHALAVGLRERGLHRAAHRFTTLAAGMKPLPVPDDILFVTPWVYSWGMLFEYSITAYWVGELDASINACAKLLRRDDLSHDHRKQTIANMQYGVQERARIAAEQPPQVRKLPHAGTPTIGRPARDDLMPKELRDDALAERLAALCGMSVHAVERRLLTILPIAAVNVEALGGWPLKLRPGTGDVRTLDEVCNGLRHLPPHEFDDPRLIFDLGAHIGIRAAHFAHRYPNARIVAVEPDPANLELCAENLKPLGDRVTLIEAAVAPRNEKGAERAEGVTAMTLDTLFDHAAPEMVVDHVSADIGSAEGLILRTDGRWPSRVRSLKLALHDRYPPGEAQEDLRRLGFDSDSADGWVSGTRSDARPPSRLQRLTRR